MKIEYYSFRDIMFSRKTSSYFINSARFFLTFPNFLIGKMDNGRNN